MRTFINIRKQVITSFNDFRYGVLTFGVRYRFCYFCVSDVEVINFSGLPFRFVILNDGIFFLILISVALSLFLLGFWYLEGRENFLEGDFLLGGWCWMGKVGYLWIFLVFAVFYFEGVRDTCFLLLFFQIIKFYLLFGTSFIHLYSSVLWKCYINRIIMQNLPSSTTLNPYIVIFMFLFY